MPWGNLNGKEIKKKKIDSLCCTAEANTALKTNYTSDNTQSLGSECLESYPNYI